MCSTCQTYFDNCLTCPASKFRIYLADVDKYTCLGCSDNCNTCLSPTNCSACSAGYFMYNYQCYAGDQCPETTFPNTGVTPNKCSACSSQCSSCTSAAVCTKCSTNYYLYQSACYSSTTCPAGTFPDTSEPVYKCSACQIENCIQCSSLTQCAACDTGYYLYTGRCYEPDDCPIGTYPDITASPKICR